MGTGAQPWLGARVGALTMPVLLVAGRLDHKFARVARALARRIPNARLELVDAAGHLPHLEQPGRFHALVRAFLDASAPAHSTTQKENLHAHRMA
jgi:pimeloyl-ACP methyl ester carboxylesterase